MNEPIERVDGMNFPRFISVHIATFQGAAGGREPQGNMGGLHGRLVSDWSVDRVSLGHSLPADAIQHTSVIFSRSAALKTR